MPRSRAGASGGRPRPSAFEEADGRDLPFADATFDHAYSISVIEHIAGDGDGQRYRSSREWSGRAAGS